MSENLLTALLELVALFARINKTRFIDNAHALVKTYLEQTVARNNLRIPIRKFYDYFETYSQKLNTTIPDANSLKTTLSSICKKLNDELSEEDRMILFLSFIELIKLDKKIAPEELAFVELLSTEIHISRPDYQNSLLFVLCNSTDQEFNNSFLIMAGEEKESSDELEGSWIEENRPQTRENTARMIIHEMEGEFLALRFQSIHFIAIRYFGNQPYQLNRKKITPDKFFILSHYDQIRLKNEQKVSYQEVFGEFQKENQHTYLKLVGKDVVITHRKSNTRFAPFNFSEDPGNLVAILCNTESESHILSQALTGQIPFHKGGIYLNGYHIFSHKYQIHKLIGFVPSVPVYDEKLCIYDIFYFNARLTFPNISAEKVRKLTDDTIHYLNLSELQKIPINKINSGIQENYLKVLINLGIEIIRDPFCFVLDLPFDKLNTSQTDELSNILKALCAKGKIVFCTVINPSTGFLKKTDRTWIFDTGGYIIYRGPTNEMLNYFKSFKTNISAEEDFCPYCGNINTEQLYSLIQAKSIDEQGRFTLQRKTSPQEFYKIYLEKIDHKNIPRESKKVIPSFSSIIPDIDVQFYEYLKKLLKIQISELPQRLLLFTIPPVVAFITAIILRTDWSSGFVLAQHKNLPLLFFLNIIGCLTIGIISGIYNTTTEKSQILHDQFKNFSFFSFLNAKLLVLLPTTIINSALFTVVSNSITQIKGLFLSHWAVYFSIMAFGCISGLFIGYLHLKTRQLVIAITIIIGLNAFLSGYLVPFNSLPKQITSADYAPALSEIIPSRWAFEALMVDQIKENNYEKKFYSLEQTISDAQFKVNYLIPKLQEKVTYLQEPKNQKTKKDYLSLIYNELSSISKRYPDIFPFEYLDSIKIDHVENNVLPELEGYLTYLQIQFYEKHKEFTNKMVRLKKFYQDSLGAANFKKFMNENFNGNLLGFVQNQSSNASYLESGNSIIQLNDAIYRLPTNNYGRAHFFSPQKFMNGYYYETLYFNLVAIWIVMSFIYISILTLRSKNFPV